MIPASLLPRGLLGRMRGSCSPSGRFYPPCGEPRRSRPAPAFPRTPPAVHFDGERQAPGLAVLPRLLGGSPAAARLSAAAEPNLTTGGVLDGPASD